MTQRTVRSRVALLGGSLAALLLGSTAAGASAAAPTPASEPIDITGDTITYVAKPGIANHVIIYLVEGGNVGITDATDHPIQPGDCEGKGTTVECDATGITRVVLKLGDRDDVQYSGGPPSRSAPSLVVHGGPGNDSIEGNFGYDEKLFGNTGDDWVKGRSGDDLVVGGHGSDHVRGYDGDDDVRGGPGRDFLRGARGDDRLDGGPGRDIVNGGEGRDTAVQDPLDLVRYVERLL